MNFRQLTNEKGITLVELLATLGLLAIVIALSSNVFTHFFSAEEKADVDIKTTQALNVIASEMKNDYMDAQIDEETRVCAKEPPGMVISIKSDNNKVVSVDNCITFKGKQDTVPLELTATNEQGNSSAIRTVFSKKKETLVSIDVKTESEEQPEEIDDVEDEETDYSPPDGECDYYGDTVFTQVQFRTDKPCPTPTVHDGSAKFSHGLTILEGVLFTIDHNLISDKSLNLEHDAKLLIKRSAKFKSPATIKRASELTIKKDLIAEQNVVLQEHSHTNIGKSVQFENGLTLTSYGELHVGGNFSTNGNLILHNNTKINVDKNGEMLSDVNLTSNAALKFGGNFTTSGNLNMHNGASIQGAKDGTFLKNINITSGELNFDRNFDLTGSLTMQNGGKVFTGGDANLSSKVTLNSGAILHIKGDAHFYKDLHVQSGAKIIVEGNAIFDGPITPKWGAGSICVKGDADIKQMPDSDIKIIENDSSCGK